MYTYTLQSIADICQAEVIGKNDLVVEHLMHDSRKLISGPNSLFIAISGQRHDGHQHIIDLYQKGVRSFLISDYHDQFSDLKGAGFCLVNNTIAALQKLTQHHRHQFNCPILGITGSNGKTVVKEWLSQSLGLKYRITRSPKSFNSQLGVPLSVWLLNEQTDWGIIEAGISRTGEMHKLQEIIDPSYGLVTNIGEAHQQNFSSIEEKLDEKLKLFVNCEVIFYCRDHELIHNTLVNSDRFNTKKLVSWSAIQKESSCLISPKKRTNRATILEINSPGHKFTITIPFTDRASIENISQLINILLHLNFAPSELQASLSELSPVAMRLEQIRGINGCTLINDSYNSDINSLKIALDFLNLQKQEQKVLILSDIQQSGLQEKELYTQIAQLVESAQIDRFIGIGQSMKDNYSVFKSENSKFYNTTEEFLTTHAEAQLLNAAVLIKGSRIYQFEKIATILSEQTHSTELEINLNNLVSNLNYFRGLITPPTKIMVMVKALSYGSGTVEIANALYHEKVDYLGVAFADEGVVLRQAGIDSPIMVMSPMSESFNKIIEYELEPEIYSFSVLNDFLKTLKANQLSSYPIHLKIDTGMHRLGFMEDEIEELTDRIKSSEHIKVQAIFSHLAASDDPKQDAFTHQQIKTFLEAYNQISAKLGYRPMRHILNSAGIERFPEAHFEMVRLGIGLHGISAKKTNLKTVSTLKTIISQIKEIPQGNTIGYNRRGVAVKPMKIAILPIGYADGLDRKLGNGNGLVVINKTKVTFIGDICMDMAMVDISGLDVKEGEKVVIFGAENSIRDLAKRIDTIPYEILTSISPRVKRVYYNE